MPTVPDDTADARTDVPPLAVRPLEYDRADAAPDGWRFAARAGAWAAVALGAAQAVEVAAFVGPSPRLMMLMVVNGFAGARPLEVLALGLATVGVLAGVALGVAGWWCLKFKPGARAALLGSLATLATAQVLTAALTIVQIFGMLPHEMVMFQAARTAATAAAGLILPALLWIIFTRPAVREQFRR